MLLCQNKITIKFNFTILNSVTMQHKQCRILMIFGESEISTQEQFRLVKKIIESISISRVRMIADVHLFGEDQLRTIVEVDRTKITQQIANELKV